VSPSRRSNPSPPLYHSLHPNQTQDHRGVLVSSQLAVAGSRGGSCLLWSWNWYSTSCLPGGPSFCYVPWLLLPRRANRARFLLCFLFSTLPTWDPIFPSSFSLLGFLSSSSSSLRYTTRQHESGLPFLRRTGLPFAPWSLLFLSIRDPTSFFADETLSPLSNTNPRNVARPLLVSFPFFLLPLLPPHHSFFPVHQHPLFARTARYWLLSCLLTSLRRTVQG